MPLYTPDGEKFMLDTLYRVITGTAYRKEMLPQMVNGLMMGRVDQGTGTIELIKEVVAV